MEAAYASTAAGLKDDKSAPESVRRKGGFVQKEKDKKRHAEAVERTTAKDVKVRPEYVSEFRPPGGGPRIVGYRKPQWVPSARSQATTRANIPAPVGQALMETLDSATQHAQQAATQQAGGDFELARAAESAAESVSDAHAIFANEEQAAAGEFHRTFQDQVAKTQALVDSAASMRIDPGRAWAAADKPMALISAILMGLGGNPEGWMRMVDTTIQRDIAAQEQGIQSEKQRAAAGADMLDMLERLYGNQQTARKAMYLTKLSTIEALLDRAAARADTNHMVRARLHDALSRIQMAKFGAGRDLMADLYGQAQQQYSERFDPGGPIIVGGGKKDEMTRKEFWDRMSDVGEKLRKTKYPALLEAKRRMEAELAGAGLSDEMYGTLLTKLRSGDRQAFKWLAGKIGGDKAQRIEQNMGRVMATEINRLSGAALSPEEARRYIEPLEEDGTPKAREYGIGMIYGDLLGEVKMIVGQHPGIIREEWRKQIGVGPDWGTSVAPPPTFQKAQTSPR